MTTSTPMSSGRAFGIRGLDHVQLAMPAGEEAAARGFYSGILGLVEVTKPSNLASAAVFGSRAAIYGCTSVSTQISSPREKRTPLSLCRTSLE